jgi:hypothetical protein
MTPVDGYPNPEHERKSKALDQTAEPATRVREAAAGMTAAQAWKGQQVAKGWHKLVDALRKVRPPSQ